MNNVNKIKSETCNGDRIGDDMHLTRVGLGGVLPPTRQPLNGCLLHTTLLELNTGVKWWYGIGSWSFWTFWTEIAMPKNINHRFWIWNQLRKEPTLFPIAWGRSSVEPCVLESRVSLGIFCDRALSVLGLWSDSQRLRRLQLRHNRQSAYNEQRTSSHTICCHSCRAAIQNMNKNWIDEIKSLGRADLTGAADGACLKNDSTNEPSRVLSWDRTWPSSEKLAPPLIKISSCDFESN